MEQLVYKNYLVGVPGVPALPLTLAYGEDQGFRFLVIQVRCGCMCSHLINSKGALDTYIHTCARIGLCACACVPTRAQTPPSLFLRRSHSRSRRVNPLSSNLSRTTRSLLMSPLTAAGAGPEPGVRGGRQALPQRPAGRLRAADTGGAQAAARAAAGLHRREA